MVDLARTFNQMAENIQSNDNSRGQFMGNIAHELRTPMTTIKGFVDGISLEDVAGAFADTQASQGSSQAIAALVSLGYSQSEAALAVSKIDASLPVEEIIKLALRSMAGRR